MSWGRGGGEDQVSGLIKNNGQEEGEKAKKAYIQYIQYIQFLPFIQYIQYICAVGTNGKGSTYKILYEYNSLYEFPKCKSTFCASHICSFLRTIHKDM